ncbi:MAG: ABC transporter permease [Bacilli bacterium]
MNILNKLTIKHLKMNKKRTIVTIIGVILSTALMTGIGLLFSTVRDNTVKNIIESNGSHHVIIDIPYNRLDLIEKNKKIKKYDYIALIGYGKEDVKKYTSDFFPYIKIITSNDNYLNKLKLIKGRLPQNSNEIVLPKNIEIYRDKGLEIEIGSTINLEVGTRFNKGELAFNSEYLEGETLINTKKISYTIVGIIERLNIESYSDPGFLSFTKSNIDEKNKLQVMIEYKNPKDTYKISQMLATTLGYKNISKNSFKNYSEITYNENLLALHGLSKYSNILEGMTGIIIIILSLVSIACIIVIYNSFAISVMERKKQFGLFASIGATKNQLRKTVFFEAIIIGIIGIPLGILSGMLGIEIVITIINNLLPEIFGIPLALSIYPLFIYIPIIFMIVTIIISAYIPALIASKVSPITAIRQNDDIKIKSKKVKVPKFIRKLFGIEGELALKNMKRNKKKYRVTIISLFISIVLFISFVGFSNYGLKSAMDYTELPEYDIQFNTNCSKSQVRTCNDIVNRIVVNEDVKDYMIFEPISLYIPKVEENYFTNEFLDYKSATLHDDLYELYTGITLIGIDNKNYNDYLKELGLNSKRPIILNKYSTIDYSDGKRKYIEYNLFNGKKFELKLYDMTHKSDKDKKEDKENYVNTNIVFENPYFTTKVPFGFKLLSSHQNNIKIIISSDDLARIRENSVLKSNDNYDNINKTLLLKTPTYKNVQKVIDKELEANKDLNLYSYNVKDQLKLINNMIFVIKMLLYGFIGLVTLIGVTSVFNTINTSIALRRKEFSALRSIGLTPAGFNKILYFESLFFGLKSLMYGIPVSIGVVYLLHIAFGSFSMTNKLLIPWDSIFIAIIGVFVIVLISMLYASSKIKKENILESIREENI